LSDLFTYAAEREAARNAQAPVGVPVDVAMLFEELALDVRDAGWKRFSSDAILHRIRWYHRIERGNRGFKCNDHWTAPLARWFLARHPDMDGFFELRERINDGYNEDAA